MDDTRALGETALLERERELERLLSALDASRAERGTALAVTGPIGIGKSQLLRELALRAAEAGHRVLEAHAGELERNYAWGVVLNLFEREVVRGDEAQLARRFSGRARTARSFLAGESLTEQYPAAPAEEFALLHSLYWLTLNLAEERPLVLIVDDVHWADEPSLRFLTYLAQRLQDLSVFLVIAARTGTIYDDDLVQRLLATCGDDPILPSTLSENAAADLLRAHARTAELADSAVHESWLVTGGNPFLLDALRHMLISGEEPAVDVDPAAIRHFAPDGVQRELLQQTERLGENALTLARACAVLGPQPSTVAFAASGLSDADAALALERLVWADILQGAEALEFRHPMYRSAIYSALAPNDRASLHAGAARALHEAGAPDAQVAHHLLLGASVDATWAVDVLHGAARLAADRGAPAQGVRLLRRALGELGDAPDRAPLLLDLAMYEAASGEVVSLKHFAEAAASFRGQDQKVDALMALGATLYRYGRTAAAAETMREACVLARDHGDHERALACKAAFYCAGSYTLEFTHGLSDLVRTDAVPLLDKEDLTDGERALMATVVLRDYLEGTPADVMAARADKALGHGALLRAETSQSVVLYAPIEGLLYAGFLGVATEAIDAALDDARARGLNLAIGEASQLRAMIMLARGNLDAAMSDARAVLASLEFGYPAGVLPRVILAECLMEQGDTEQAQAELALAKSRKAAEDPTAGHALCAHGKLLLMAGRAPEALEAFLEAGRVADRHHFYNPAILPWRARAALAAHLSGRPREAEELIEESLRLTRAAAAPAPIALTLRIKAETVPPEASVGLLLEAVALLRDSGAELELAKALLALGRVQRRLGQRANAREHLRGALALSHCCGATRLESAVQEELRAAGARPRRAAISGLESLTSAEHRVVVRAARGLTNRAIAEELFVTKNTVDWHLRNAYLKLDVHRRDELPLLLSTADEDDGEVRV